jgi:hypothetical protein
MMAMHAYSRGVRKKFEDTVVTIHSEPETIERTSYPKSKEN